MKLQRPVRPLRPVHLDPSLPLQHQIFVQLRAEIVDGLWATDAGFPGEKEIAQRFGVSLMTSRAALRRLAEEGWVVRGRGRRSEAVMQPPVAAEASAAPAAELPTGAAILPFKYKVLDAGIRIAPALACAAMGLPPGSELWSCTRLRTLKGRPHSVTVNVQTPERARRHTSKQLQQLPMAEILSGQGVAFGRMTRQVAAGLPVPPVAEHLHLRISDPVLVYTLTLHDTSDTAVEWVRIFVHPEQPSPVEVLDIRTGRWSSDITV